MNKQKALEKLKKSKREGLANSSEIKVGRLELNEAMKALRTIIALENVINNKWNKSFNRRMEKRYDLFRISKKDKECI